MPLSFLPIFPGSISGGEQIVKGSIRGLVDFYLADELFYSLFINLTPLGSALKGFSLEGNLTGLIPLDIYFDNPPPLSPSLHKGGGIGYVREASPLFNFLLKKGKV